MQTQQLVSGIIVSIKTLITKNKMRHFHLFLILVLFLFSGCQTTDSLKTTTQLARQKHLSIQIIQTSGFPIMAMQPGFDKSSDILRIYIEGDGKAWMRSGRPSSNPTPVNRLVHKIMTEDEKRDIAYLARPCQFIMQPDCSSYIWTFGRYDQKVIDSINEAITKLKQQYDFKQLELIGYSGGATIALIIAAKRNDVISVRTVAGNLDPEFTNNFHKVSPMPTALNPVSFANNLKQVPQIHFYGENDLIIPKGISDHYLKYFVDSTCIQTVLVEKASHHDGWAEKWAGLLTKEAQCKTKKAHIY